ncbi:uncharacterized protein LOC105275925 isoform X4 [Ooceraea biroi]|uniref:uncharacterized protein LOC105275925 isoform X4 n=1 Tax=Ooceraea biroi TaxID=2015173 RepID=UPI000F07E6DB|nr:uncharacterized protein LOC105275925 isoform X4 [Ooceraea biroi]
MKYPNNANRDFEWAVKLNRISLEMIGLWPKPEKIRRDELKRNLYVFVVLLMLVIVGLFPCTLSLLRIQQNFTLIIEQLQFLLPLVTCVIRLVIFWWKKEGIDNFLGLLVFHICGQMEILMARFSCLSKLTKFRNGLESCVRNHIRLLRAIAIIEDTYNKILLALFLYFGLLFAFFGFLLISLIEESYVSITRILYLVSNLINMIVHMVLYCAVGEILVSQCDKVYYAICDQEWYLLDPRNAKDLIFLMIRTRISSYITAGKIFPMTMATFCNLVKTSVSYVSVMVTIKN